MIETRRDRDTVHGTAVAFDDRALLVTGPSGSGKSALALQLIGLGARLIADDLVALHLVGEEVRASCPNPALRGVIEARGVGLLAAPVAPEGLALRLVVALPPLASVPRLPDPETTQLLGCVIPLVRAVDSPHFPVALMLHLRHGRLA